MEGQELEVLQGMTELLRAERVKAIYFDGYKDSQVETPLAAYGFCLWDGQTLEPLRSGAFSLLALHRTKNHLSDTY